MITTKLKRLMQAANIASVPVLLAHAGLTRQTWWNWMGGSGVSESAAKRVGEVLKCSPGEALDAILELRDSQEAAASGG